jgi:hypothetical protein
MCLRSKILALKQVLQLSKYVLWLDSDAIVTRFDTPLLPYFLKLTDGKDAVFSSEFDQSLNARDELLERRCGACGITVAWTGGGDLIVKPVE